jgi:hypothetical protein
MFVEKISFKAERPLLAIWGSANGSSIYQIGPIMVEVLNYPCKSLNS